MKVTNVNQLASNFKPGDIVWGCAYAYNQQNGNGDTINQLPVKGMLSPCRHEKEYANIQNNTAQYINYFIPMKKDGKTPAWQKAIRVYALKYASTEDECKELYNELVKANIDWHKREIARLKKQLIRLPKPVVTGNTNNGKQ